MKSENDFYNDTKIAVLQTTNLHIHETLHRIEKRLDNLDAKIDTLNTKIDSNFKWVVASILLVFGSSALASLLTVTAKIMHWTT